MRPITTEAVQKVWLWVHDKAHDVSSAMVLIRYTNISSTPTAPGQPAHAYSLLRTTASICHRHAQFWGLSHHHGNQSCICTHDACSAYTILYGGNARQASREQGSAARHALESIYYGPPGIGVGRLNQYTLFHARNNGNTGPFTREYYQRAPSQDSRLVQQLQRPEDPMWKAASRLCTLRDQEAPV
jgi:hypothetical protein